MNIYSHITFTALILYIFLVIYILYLDYKGKLNRIFSFIFICLTIWSLGAFFMYFQLPNTDFWFWYRLSAIGQCYFPIAVLHFFSTLTNYNLIFRKWWSIILCYTIPMIFLFKYITGQVVVKDIIIKGSGAVQYILNFSPWYYSFQLYEIVCIFISLLLVIRWRGKLKHPKERKQALVILCPSVFSYIVGLIIGIYLPNFKHTDTFLLIPAAAVFAAMGIWYAVAKYKLMVMSPSLAADSILDTILDSLILTNRDLKITTVNKETCKLLGFTENELLGKDIEMVFGNDELFSRAAFLQLLERGPIRNYEIQFIAKGGRNIPVEFSVSEHKDSYGNLIGIVIIARDITEQKLTEERLRHLAHHDFLTGLANRLLFTDRLKQALISAQRYNRLCGLILLDADHFKEVNDEMGHENGDKLLVEIANRLKAAVRKSDTIARFGGDEFVVIINELLCVSDIHEVAAKIHGAFSKKFTIGCYEVNVSSSMGVSIFPFDGEDSETLLKNADMAMYFAKNKGRNNYQLYSEIPSAEKQVMNAQSQKSQVIDMVEELSCPQ